MSDKEDEAEREIIQVRRIIPKKKSPSAPPPADEELKNKAKELKKRLFQMQIALGAAVVFFLFLALRASGCFQKTPREFADVPNAPIFRFENAETLDARRAPKSNAERGSSQALGARRTNENFGTADYAARFDVFADVENFRDVPPFVPSNAEVPNLNDFEKRSSAKIASNPPQNFRNQKYLFEPSRTQTESDAASTSAPAFSSDRSTPPSVSSSAPLPSTAARANSADFPPNLRVVRIATWNLGAFDFAKLSDFNVGQKVAKTIQEFDLVALQGIRAKNLAVLDGLVYLIANDGADYSYVASTPGRDAKILAFFFNANAVEVDRSTVSDVFDSQARLRTPGLVAAFQTANVDAKKRFTFQITNYDLSNEIPPNGAALADAYRTLQKSAGALGVSEDDVLLVGDFGVAIQKIKELGSVPNLVAIHVDKPTDARGGSSVNILFDSIATTEYVERFGVVDLADYFDISAAEASKIAPTRPVWADFSVYEGGDAQFSAPPSVPFAQ